MTTAKEIISFLEELFPLSKRAAWDNTDGLVCGVTTNEVKRLILSIELRKNIIYEENDMIILHHPPVFGKDREITNHHYSPIKESQNPPVVYALHSRMDVVGFMNKAIGKKLLNDWIKDTKILGDGTAIFILEKETTLQKVTERIKSNLKIKNLNGIVKKTKIKKIAIHGGEGFNKHHIIDAIDEDIDLYLAGDMTHHLAEFADRHPVTFIDIQHFTEQEGMNTLKSVLEKRFRNIDCEYIEQQAIWSDL